MFNVGQVYVEEPNLETSIKEENSYHWYGNIGLLNPGDFIRASMNEQCNSYKYFWDTMDCKKENYLYKSNNAWWFMAMNKSTAATGTFVYDDGGLGTSSGTNYAVALNNVRPALHLKSNITLSGGGTNANPYIIN